MPNSTIATIPVRNGEEVPIRAIPDGDYRFTHWDVTGDATVTDSSAASTTVTIDNDNDDDVTVTASFNDNYNYTLTVNAGTGGSLSPVFMDYSNLKSLTKWAENVGDPIEIVAYEHPDSVFNGWSATGGSSKVTIADANSYLTTVSFTGSGT